MFAHPDDETVACAGTIQQLTNRGDEVFVVLATAGDAGEVSPEVRKQNPSTSVSAIRRAEVEKVQTHLKITEIVFLEYKDGAINNQMVWGELVLDICGQINHIKPDIVITFDHSGWYFHLDHVGISIATTLAYHQAGHRPQALLLSHFRVTKSKWKYVFNSTIPVTHQVLVSDIGAKLKAAELHASQNLSEPKRQIISEQQHYEHYQLGFATEEGLKTLQQDPLFQETPQFDYSTFPRKL